MNRLMCVICISFLSLLFLFPGAALATDKPELLRVSTIADFSGPYAPVVGQLRAGSLDAWKYVNSELGGVHGVKVKPVIKDMTGKVALGLSQYNEIINMKPKPFFVDTAITPLAEALRERCVENNMVGIHAGAICSLYPQGNSYAYYPLYPEQVGCALKWILANRWKKKRNLKIGILTWDTSYGRAILVKPFYDYLKKINVDLVETQVFGIREVDLTTQLMKLRAKKPDYLVTNTAAGGPLAIKKGLKEMGWDIPLLNGMGSCWGTIRLDPPLFEGDIVPLSHISFDETDHPAIKTIMRYFKQNKRTENDKDMFYIMGWVNAFIEHKIMTEVVDKHGWGGLNAKNIVAAMNQLKDFVPLGGITRITYTAKRRTPTVVKIFIVKGGKFIPQTGFLEVPDMRPEKFK